MNTRLERVLITVKTYPNPSHKYEETVCTFVETSIRRPHQFSIVGVYYPPRQRPRCEPELLCAPASTSLLVSDLPLALLPQQSAVGSPSSASRMGLMTAVQAA
jgi:hypothetical protein